MIEDLAVRNMVKNGRLARAISDAAWSDFRSMLAYRLPLHVRTWTCDCGTTRDRDVNAAKNILAVGLTASVCGAGVRPQRSSPGGQSATKQKTPRREP